MIWTVERIEELKADWATGLSAGAIATRLGHPYVSRNAVIGKVHRLNLPKRKTTLGIERTGAPPKRLRRPNRDVVGLLSNRAADRGKIKLPESKVPIEPTTVFNCTLLELTNESCRWPIGGLLEPAKFFCGSPSADLANRISYCGFHARYAYMEYRR